MGNCRVVEPYTIEQCDERIIHWKNEIKSTRKFNETVDKRKQKSTDTLEKILSFWIGYKDFYYGKKKDNASTSRKNEENNSSSD